MHDVLLRTIYKIPPKLFTERIANQQIKDDDSTIVVYITNTK